MIGTQRPGWPQRPDPDRRVTRRELLDTLRRQAQTIRWLTQDRIRLAGILAEIIVEGVAA